MRLRISIIMTLALIVAGMFASVAWASTSTIITDASDGTVNGHYSAAQVRAALAAVENDPSYSQYSDIAGELPVEPFQPEFIERVRDGSGTDLRKLAGHGAHDATGRRARLHGRSATSAVCPWRCAGRSRWATAPALGLNHKGTPRASETPRPERARRRRQARGARPRRTRPMSSCS